jgi:DNA repair protein RecO (recombination protein O)
MNWDDAGFLVIKKQSTMKIHLLPEIFTKEHGKVSGIIFGGTSKKIKNYLQVGNLLIYNIITPNQLIELVILKLKFLKRSTPIYFDDPQKLNCISSVDEFDKNLNCGLPN